MVNLRNLILSIVFSAGTGAGFAQDSADVIVYGSTPGGFSAAIAAAREGASVILLEPTQHIGGLSTGGLSHCDSNQMVRETLMGIFDEWHRRIVKDYTERGLPAPYDATLKDTAKWTFEPHVAMRVTLAMLQESGVIVKTGRYLKSVTKDGPRITSLVTKDGTFSAKVFVDGSYEGDLMAAAGVDWTIGREGRAEFGESLAGKQYPKTKMNISGFDDAGKLLPLVTTSDAGPEEAGDRNIMTFSFRLCLTRDPAKVVPVPAPAHYDPARFELARRMLKAGIKVGFDPYPLPGGKFDGNNSIHGQLSLGLVGGCNTWHNADEAGRQKIWEEHRQYTLEFLHFLKTDPAVPAKIRNAFSDLGLCKDEFAQTAHFPPALYVRESRRMKGMYVLTQNDIMKTPEKEDPIAISSFPIDSHDCQRVALRDGGVINEGTIFPVRVPGANVGYAYHVPYRSVLPQAAQCTNLLVPIALSSTHVAMSSLRIEGAWMVIGQGSGVAAALAAKDNIAVQKVQYPKLRERLLAQGQVLKLPAPSKKSPANEAANNPVKSQPGIVLDDADAKLEGEWVRSSNFKPHIGSGYLVNGGKDVRSDGKASATFRLTVPKSGEYKVLMAYSAHETRAKNVPITILSGGRETKLTVDQTRPLPEGQQYQSIGTVNLSAEGETTIQIKNMDTVGFVILDALQLVPLQTAPAGAIKARDKSAAKPNVLLISIDDLNDWVGCLGGHPQAVTPNMDRLAARGMLFSNAHSQGTLCNPSRISVLWGYRPSSTGFYENDYPVSKEPEFLKNHVSLPAHFGNNGYETLTTGKVFHTVMRDQSQVQGPVPEFWLEGLDKENHQRPPQWHQIWDFGPQDYDESQFTDHLVASWAVKQIAVKRDRPFFLSVGFRRPHVPMFSPRRIYDKVGDVQLPAVKEDDWNDLPAAARKLTMSNEKIPAHEWMLHDNRWQSAVKAYLACVRWTDEQVGRVLDALEASPNAGNTIVVLFSDHGYHLGEKQRWEKFSLWERSTHVPLIISLPGGETGRSSKPVELLSIYPTLIELCGLPPNPKLEGVSLRPLLENPDARWEHVAISTLGQNNHALRDGRWRYIRYADGSEELYDHESDPNEWNNLAAGKLTAAQAEVIGRLKQHLPKTNIPQRSHGGA